MKIFPLLLFFVTCCVVLLSISAKTTFAFASTISTTKRIRGVMTELQERYAKALDTEHSTFACLDGSKTIKASRVNDEFCDCPDGSDEPGTAACTFEAASRRSKTNPYPTTFRFQCTNEGFDNLKQQFFHSRVNDGICDCCDGSDEYLYTTSSATASSTSSSTTATKCPNVCAAYSAQREEEERSREATRQAGLKSRAELLAKAQKQRDEWNQELITVEGSLEQLKKDFEAALAQVSEWEPREREAREQIHKQSLAKKAEWEIEQEAEKKKRKGQQVRQEDEEEKPQQEQQQQAEAPPLPPSVKEQEMQQLDANQQEQQHQQILEESAEATAEIANNNNNNNNNLNNNNNNNNNNIECISWRQTKDCSGSGEREPQGDRSCDQVIEGGASGYCDCKADGTDETYPFDCGHQRLKCEKVCLHRGSDDAFENAEPAPQDPASLAASPLPEPEFKVDDGSSFNLPEARDARTKRDEAQAKLTASESTIKDLKDNLAKEWGADNVFLGLANECFEKQAGEFTYKLCPMKGVHQGHTSLGNFKSFGTQTYGSWGGKSDYSKQLYDGGTHCWGGPARNCEVILVCGPENVIKSVEEPSMCSYKMVFQTPAICE